MKIFLIAFLLMGCGKAFQGKVDYSGIDAGSSKNLFGKLKINLKVIGSSDILADGSSSTQLAAEALDSNGNSISNLKLHLLIPSHGGLTSNNPALTNSSGIATWTLTSSTTQGVYSYQASGSGQTSNAVEITFSAPSPEFITRWQTTPIDPTITLPLLNTGTYNFTVDWGDGNEDLITAWDDPKKTHTYSQSGIHTITMIGVFSHFAFNNSGDKNKIIDILKWGRANIWAPNGLENAFYGCTNLNITTTDSPNLTQTQSLYQMFKDATSFNADIGHWDTSNVANMSGMFSGASSFNQNIGGWNTSNVTNLSWMFENATSFNQNIGLWNTTKVVNMNGTFAGASSFNQNISAWNTQNVTDTSYMFSLASTFNQNIGNWDTSNVTDMNGMFSGAISFNQNIGNWETGKVTNLGGMFLDANTFNQNIAGWDTSNVTNMSFMFENATAFNQNISTWDTSLVTNMSRMFFGASAFNQNISGWETSHVANMNQMFSGASSFNFNLTNWAVNPNVTGCYEFKFNANQSNFIPPIFLNCSM